MIYFPPPFFGSSNKTQGDIHIINNDAYIHDFVIHKKMGNCKFVQDKNKPVYDTLF